MSSPARRAALRAKREAEERAFEEEQRRIAGLSLYERIEECGNIHDIKAVLHLIVEKAGMDPWQ